MSMIRRSLLILLWASTVFGATGATLKNDLRLRLGQTSGSNSNWTDAQLYRCLNMAQSYVAGIATPLERLDTIIANSSQIATPSGFVKLKDNSYLWRNGKILRAIPRVSMDSLSKIMGVIDKNKYGQDKFIVAQDGGIIILAPEPDPFSADSILLSFYVSASVLDSVTECSFTDEWESVLLDAAEVFALKKIQSVEQPLAIQERDKHVALMYRSGVVRPPLGSGLDK